MKAKPEKANQKRDEKVPKSKNPDDEFAETDWPEDMEEDDDYLFCTCHCHIDGSVQCLAGCCSRAGEIFDNY